ncbi:acid phosphatase AphA [Vibrio marisflavi]|uniref:Class B acid phosphatase n=1 Tax=Vibrio marisflavi CECT 7928 TaxID=634439 RepID=A0ABM9A3Y6_9VIBR|nr:acid phosphatase AphA [Vibrio marisflavi]CAH0539259.1 Class B acid phosphatase [Vibrio marisflavi CECT 7928]
MTKTKLLLSTLALAIAGSTLALPAQATTETLNPGVTINQLSERQPIHWVSIEQIAASLKGKPPMSVGFDVDDTVLFSSPAFFHGKQVFSPNSNDYLKNHKFWDEVSNGWDKFSIPKESGRELIELHLKRGDHIYFITGRPKPTSGHEELTEIIQKDFNIPSKDMNPVIFSGPSHGAKTSYIKDHKIKLYYGDSDGDILDARAAGAEGIRVLRPSNSTNRPMPHNGSLGEKVLVNSQY